MYTNHFQVFVTYTSLRLLGLGSLIKIKTKQKTTIEQSSYKQQHTDHNQFI